MNAKPMLFSGPMIQALSGGTKNQTRRVVKLNSAGHVKEPCGHRRWHPEDTDAVLACPYGRPGDLLWCRETWHPVMESHPVVLYRADNEVVYHDTGRRCPNVIYEQPTRWKPSIYMPRWASRLTLEITDVRVERVQEISEEDAEAEGPERGTTVGWSGSMGSPVRMFEPYQHAFRHLWDSINGAKKGYGWNANPFVWALTFRVVQRNINDVLREPAEEHTHGD